MITVALPIWKMKDIMWLQLESLCNQVDAPPWELIVMECGANDAIGEVKHRLTRLHEAGMSDFVYLHSDVRIPLGLKWRTIANRASGDVMLLCAGDNYSPPNRLELSQHWIEGEGYDWFDVGSGLFYDINTRETGQWYRRYKDNSGLWMAAKTEHLKGLDANPPNIDIDHWIKSQLPEDFRWMQLPGPLAGLHTDGKNTISKCRAGCYNNGGFPKNFKLTGKQELSECAPNYVIEKLKRMKP